MFINLLALALPILPPAGRLVSQEPARIWVGGVGEPFAEKARWDPFELELELDPAGDSVGGLLRRRDGAHPLEGHLAEGRVDLVCRVKGGEEYLTGELDGEQLAGTWSDGKEEAPFVLFSAQVPADGLGELTGIYQRADGGLVSVDLRGRWPTWVDLTSGEIRVLYARSRDELVAGPALRVPLPVESVFRFERDDAGHVSGFERTAPDEEPETAALLFRPTSRELEVESFDDIRLAGTLWTPPGDGPFPAALWVHGSGEVTRMNHGVWRDLLLSRGFAFLAVDKRGVGSSGGSYALPDGGHDNGPHMARRARDVAAAHAVLRACKEVDGERVGLIGGSQAGWVIPQAAGRCHPAFTITVSGGATQIDVEGRFSDLTDEMTADHRSRSIEAALARTRRYRARGESYRPFFERMDCPALWLYGLRDRSNPSALCIELLEAVRTGERRDFTVSVYPTANHGLLEARLGGARESSRLRRFAPGLFAEVDAWLQEHVAP